MRVGDRVKWSPGAVIRARHEGVGLSKTWFEIAERQGVEIRYETSAVRLVQDGKSHVTGVTVQDAEGFHADAPPYGDRKLTDKTNRLSYPYGVLVNLNGRRFFDEGEDFQFYTHAKLGGVILGEPGGVAYQIFDAKVTHLLEGRYKTGRPMVADSLEKLVGQLTLDRDACMATLEAYNKAATDSAFGPDRARRSRGGSPLAEIELGAASRHAAVRRVSGDGRHHVHVRRRTRQ